MNLHGIAAPAIGAVNPSVDVTVKISNGYTTDAAGARVPQYLPDQIVPAQIQALAFRDLMQLDGLNLQGTRRKIYFYGEVDGLVRATNKGGDLVIFPDGSVWLVAMVLEQWPDWCSVAVTLQDGL